MTCIHGLGSSTVDSVIYDIPSYNEIIKFDILNNHEPDYDHRPLTITFNLAMHSDYTEENFDGQKHLIFDKNKVDLVLDDLKNNIFPLSYMNTIENLYHNFTKSLSSSIEKFSIDVSRRKRDRITNPWYDQECKDARNEIKKTIDESLKLDIINQYKNLTKRKKSCYLSKMHENLLLLYIRWLLINSRGKF